MPASFSSVITCSAFSAKASLCVTAIICSIALNLEMASASLSMLPSSLPRLSVGSSSRSMLSPCPVRDCMISCPSPRR